MGKELHVPKGISAMPNYHPFTDLERQKISSLVGKRESPSRSYYLIGSKYGASNDQDMLPVMLQRSIVCVGFHRANLSRFYSKPEAEIIKYLVSKNEKRKSYSALKLFLQLVPGDIVAIKSNGSPLNGKPNLEIAAYAMIVQRNGSVYSYNAKLRHCLNVEFIETNVARKFNIGGYGRTIHRIDDISLQRKLFTNYGLNDDFIIRDKIRHRGRVGVTNKSTTPQTRSGSQPYVCNQHHNEIQNQMFAALKMRHGEKAVTMEVDHIDLKVDLGDSLVIYEVKPYGSPEHCIREALGQVLAYGFFSRDKRVKKYIVVGPNIPSANERHFIKFIKKSFKLDFDYMGLDDFA